MKFLDLTCSRSLVAAAVSFAITVSQPALAANAQVELVPDDSLFFIGSDKPVGVEDFFSMLPGGFDIESFKVLLPEANDGDSEAFQKISDFLNDPAAFAKQWGVGDEFQFSAYTVGVMPVFRITADGDQFKSALAKVTADNELAFDVIDHKGIEVRIATSEHSADIGAAYDQKLIMLESVKTKQEQEISELKTQNNIASQALEQANAALELAKTNNDAGGIADAANKIAEAASKVSDNSAELAKLEAGLADMTATVETAKKERPEVESGGPGFIAASVGDDLVFSIASDAYDPEVLDQLLGLSAPAVSLQTSGKLKEIRSEWGYGDEMAAYLDFQLVADALTGGESLAATQIKALTADGDGAKELKEFSTDPCKAEIRGVAEHWPMLVSGNRRFEVSDDTVEYDSHFAMISANSSVLSTLQLLRGAVPASQSSSEAMFSMGLGLSVDTAPQLSAQVTDLISGINYECEVFEAFNSLATTDISALSLGAVMFSGMARGIKGISFNLYDGEVDANAPIPLTGIDGAIAIAAEDPASLVQTLRLVPQMSTLGDLPLDGTPVSLNSLIPVPMPTGVEVFAAVKDKNIVIYSGEEAEDFANRLSGSGDEGFLFSTINTRKLISKFTQVVEQLPESVRTENDLDKATEVMKVYPTGKISYKMDFTDKGIEFESSAQMDRSNK